MEHDESARSLSRLFSEIYFHCHPSFEIELSYQAVRVMQFLALCGPATVHAVSTYLGVAHNTASEIVQRLQSKDLVVKQRRRDDERVVEVSLTAHGEKTVWQHTGLDIDRLAEALGKLSEDERMEIQSALVHLLHAVAG